MLVIVEVAAAAPVELELVYSVPGAAWWPAYDLHFSPRDGTVTLYTAGQVQQATGEDWQDARVLLSTARPRLGSEAPKPAQLWVDGGEASAQKVLVQSTERRERLQADGDVAAQAAQGAELDDRGQSFVLTLPRRVTV